MTTFRAQLTSTVSGLQSHFQSIAKKTAKESKLVCKDVAHLFKSSINKYNRIVTPISRSNYSPEMKSSDNAINQRQRLNTIAPTDPISSNKQNNNLNMQNINQGNFIRFRDDFANKIIEMLDSNEHHHNIATCKKFIEANPGLYTESNENSNNTKSKIESQLRSLFPHGVENSNLHTTREWGGFLKSIAQDTPKNQYESVADAYTQLKSITETAKKIDSLNNSNSSAEIQKLDYSFYQTANELRALGPIIKNCETAPGSHLRGFE